jgi:hypothetical protein
LRRSQRATATATATAAAAVLVAGYRLQEKGARPDEEGAKDFTVSYIE